MKATVFFLPFMLFVMYYFGLFHVLMLWIRLEEKHKHEDNTQLLFHSEDELVENKGPFLYFGVLYGRLLDA